MPHPPLEELFQQTRHELQSLGSVLPHVQQRISSLPLHPPSQLRARSAAAIVTLLLFLALLLSRLHTPPPLAAAPQDFQIEVDGIQLTEHLAAILDHRAVVVIWTYRGPTLPTLPANGRVGKYQLRTLDHHPLPGGRTFVCSLFLPDPGVHPALEPPSLFTTSANNNIIACTTSPHPATPTELAAAIQSAGGNAKSDLLDIFRQLPTEIH